MGGVGEEQDGSGQLQEEGIHALPSIVLLLKKFVYVMSIFYVVRIIEGNE